MRKILVGVAIFLLLGGVVVSDARAQTGVLQAPVNRFSLLMQDWRDRLALWTTFDEQKKAEVELRIIERYETEVERVENLPEEVDKEELLKLLESRRDHWLDSLEARAERREEVREMLQARIGELEEGAELRERLMQQEREQMQEQMEEQQEEMEQAREETRERMELRMDNLMEQGEQLRERIEQRIRGVQELEDETEGGESYIYESEDGSVRVESTTVTSSGDGSYAKAVSKVVVNSN